jgi:heme oxygenase
MRKADYADVYGTLGSANFHETCRMIGEQWRSFAESLKAAREGRLAAGTPARLQEER